MAKGVLTKSELRIMKLLFKGKLYKEIAEENKISINTVKNILKIYTGN